MRARPLACTVAVLALLAGAARAADDEPADLPEGVLAKMARLRTKGELAPRDRETDLAGRRKADPASCGSVNIGNVEAPKAGQRAPKEVFVFVKGPVINADNKCSR